MNEVKQNILEQEKCYQIIRKKLNLDSLDEFFVTYEFEPRSEFLGFLGQYFNLKVILVNRKTSESQNISFFMKLLPIKGVQCDFVQESRCFDIEHGLYKKIFPKILTPLKKNCIPEFFLGLKEKIVLEDMENKKFKMLDKFEFLHREHLLIIVENLAWFHAKSLIFEERNKITVIEFCHENDVLINFNDDAYQSSLNYFSQNLSAMFDLMENIDLEKKEKCKEIIVEITSQHFKKTGPSTNRRNVLCHADLWTNNILFKSNESGTVEQCCFIDFQMTRYCSPAYDLLYLLYCTTSREFRKNESKNLFMIYYETLYEYLKETKIDLRTIFTWNNLIDSIEEIKLSCMMHAFVIMSITLLGLKASEQRTKALFPITKIVCQEFNTDERYKGRMLDSLLDLCDNISFDYFH